MKLRMAFLWSMVAAFVASAAIGVFAIIMPGSQQTEQLLVTALLVGAFSLLGMICAFVLDKRRLHRPLYWLMWFGIGASAVALGGWLTLVWLSPTVDEDTFVRVSAIGTFCSCWAAHLGMMAILPLMRDAGRIVRVLTIFCTSLLTVTLITIVFIEDVSETVGRFMAVLAILGACGTVVSPILSVVDWLQTRGTRESMPTMLRISLQCPRCGSSEQLKPGASSCSACGLRIEINVQEPRCEGCGYLLYRLEGDTCPECGAAIPQEKRWVAAKRADEPNDDTADDTHGLAASHNRPQW